MNLGFSMQVVVRESDRTTNLGPLRWLYPAWARIAHTEHHVRKSRPAKQSRVQDIVSCAFEARRFRSTRGVARVQVSEVRDLTTQEQKTFGPMLKRIVDTWDVSVYGNGEVRIGDLFISPEKLRGFAALLVQIAEAIGAP